MKETSTDGNILQRTFGWRENVYVMWYHDNFRPLSLFD